MGGVTRRVVIPFSPSNPRGFSTRSLDRRYAAGRRDRHEMPRQFAFAVGTTTDLKLRDRIQCSDRPRRKS
jgi:hypothetical protein